MDAIAGLLDGPRARGAFLLKLAFAPPWALRIQDEAPIAVISVVRGSALIYGDGEAPIRIGAGEVAIARGPRPYTVGVSYTHGFLPFLRTSAVDRPLDALLTEDGVMWQRP